MISSAWHYSYSALFTGIANYLLLILVARKGLNRPLIQKFLLYCFAIAHWSFFVFICTIISDTKISYLFSNICHSIGVFIPILFFDLLSEFSMDKSRFSKFFKFFFYVLISFISLTIVIHPQLFITEVKPKLSFPNFPEPGYLFVVWTVIFFFIVVVALIRLFVMTRRSSGI